MFDAVRETHADIVALPGPMPAWEFDDVDAVRLQTQATIVRMLIEIWMREVQQRVRTERRIRHLRRNGRC